MHCAHRSGPRAALRSAVAPSSRRSARAVLGGGGECEDFGAAFNFPDDLLGLQRDLQQASADYAEFCAALPWSVEPMDGWEGREASPGYTSEQRECVDALRARLLELSIVVTTHSYFEQQDGRVVEARMALKHALDGEGIRQAESAAA